MADTNCRIIHIFSKGSKLQYYSNIVGKQSTRKDSRTGKEILEYVKNQIKKRRKGGGKK